MVPDGSGVACLAQSVPFHTAAKVTVAPCLLTLLPTASQLVVLIHDTVLKDPFGVVGFGVLWINRTIASVDAWAATNPRDVPATEPIQMAIATRPCRRRPLPRRGGPPNTNDAACNDAKG